MKTRIERLQKWKITASSVLLVVSSEFLQARDLPLFD
jgi:hypothetical protein